MKIIQRLSPNHGGRMVAHKFIMLHHTASTSFNGTVSYFRSSAAKSSAHFVVGKKGEVAQLVPMSLQAWHAGLGDYEGIPKNKGNAYCIGIEIVNKGNGSDPFPAAQLKALDDLIAHIDKHFGKRMAIIDHKAYAPTRKVDMRANFPLSNYKKYRRHEAPDYYTVVAKGSYVTVRATPAGKKVGIVLRGKTVRLLSTKLIFAKIKQGDLVGWVPKRNIKRK